MNTQSTVLDNASVEATTPDRILQTALAAWRQGNFVEVVDQFSDQFTFIDHALELEFRDKERLTEFLAKIIGLFPDSERKVNTIFSNGDHVISEGTLTATHTEPFLGGHLRKVPIYVRGVSIAQIKNGKITQWSDYYDQLKLPALHCSDLVHRVDWALSAAGRQNCAASPRLWSKVSR
jgi:steroid delta-isomerase-like uncharacterized protein